MKTKKKEQTKTLKLTATAQYVCEKCKSSGK